MTRDSIPWNYQSHFYHWYWKWQEKMITPRLPCFAPSMLCQCEIDERKKMGTNFAPFFFHRCKNFRTAWKMNSSVIDPQMTFELEEYEWNPLFSHNESFRAKKSYDAHWINLNFWFRPFCPNSAFRGVGTSKDLSLRYVPRQTPSNPDNLFFVNGLGARIEFEESLYQWTLSFAGCNVTAKSQASKSSYVLGKYNWTFEGDSKCPEKEYLLKLTGCFEGQFTCSDGECISMEGRCDHVFHCRDRCKKICFFYFDYF